MKRSASFSAHTAPADSIHDTPLIDASDTTASNNIDALVGADGIHARKRGLSARITAGASTVGEELEHGVGIVARRR